MSDYKELLLKRKKAAAAMESMAERANRMITLRTALVSDLDELSSSEDTRKLLDLDVELSKLRHEYEMAALAMHSADVDLDDLIDKEVEARECQKTS